MLFLWSRSEMGGLISCWLDWQTNGMIDLIIEVKAGICSKLEMAQRIRPAPQKNEAVGNVLAQALFQCTTFFCLYSIFCLQCTCREFSVKLKTNTKKKRSYRTLTQKHHSIQCSSHSWILRPLTIISNSPKEMDFPSSDLKKHTQKDKNPPPKKNQQHPTTTINKNTQTNKNKQIDEAFK